MTESLQGPAGERPSLAGSASSTSNIHIPASSVSSGFIAAGCSDTPGPQMGIAECGVTAFIALNAVKVFTAEEGRNKRLIDWRFSEGFGYEIGERGFPLEFTDTGFQLLRELLSPDPRPISLHPSTPYYIFQTVASPPAFVKRGGIGKNRPLSRTSDRNGAASRLQTRNRTPRLICRLWAQDGSFRTSGISKHLPIAQTQEFSSDVHIQ